MKLEQLIIDSPELPRPLGRGGGRMREEKKDYKI